MRPDASSRTWTRAGYGARANSFCRRRCHRHSCCRCCRCCCFARCRPGENNGSRRLGRQVDLLQFRAAFPRGASPRDDHTAAEHQQKEYRQFPSVIPLRNELLGGGQPGDLRRRDAETGRLHQYRSEPSARFLARHFRWVALRGRPRLHLHVIHTSKGVQASPAIERKDRVRAGITMAPTTIHDTRHSSNETLTVSFALLDARGLYSLRKSPL